MEEWKEIENTNGDYLISNHGRVKGRRCGLGIKNFKLLDPSVSTHGYKIINIRFNNSSKRKKVLVHRLVADYFVAKPDDYNKKMEVNHKDSNRINNHYSNLEYVTSSGNTEHAVVNKRLIPWNNPRKPIIAINLTTGEEIEFVSISKAEIFFNSRHIVDVLKKRRNQVKGYVFKYKEVLPNEPSNNQKTE